MYKSLCGHSAEEISKQTLKCVWPCLLFMVKCDREERNIRKNYYTERPQDLWFGKFLFHLNCRRHWNVAIQPFVISQQDPKTSVFSHVKFLWRDCDYAGLLSTTRDHLGNLKLSLGHLSKGQKIDRGLSGEGWGGGMCEPASCLMEWISVVYTEEPQCSWKFLSTRNTLDLKGTEYEIGTFNILHTWNQLRKLLSCKPLLPVIEKEVEDSRIQDGDLRPESWTIEGFPRLWYFMSLLSLIAAFLGTCGYFFIPPPLETMYITITLFLFHCLILGANTSSSSFTDIQTGCVWGGLYPEPWPYLI